MRSLALKGLKKKRFLSKRIITPAILLLFIGCQTGKDNSMNKNELKKRLTPLQYTVTQESGTEKPFDNTYWNNTNAGIYVDIVSGEPLFSSIDKFKSGTGWPSFFRPLQKENIVENTDNSHGMARVEVRSKKGNSHLGHLFNDGPAPTGMRYCINSASLRFIPVADLKKEGLDQYLSLFSNAVPAPEPAKHLSTATFAGGCFWGVQAILAKIPGVIQSRSGYTGGHLKNPTYQQVCSGTTGHAEAVTILYDPKKVKFNTLLNYFWRLHNPTTKKQTGAGYRQPVPLSHILS